MTDIKRLNLILGILAVLILVTSCAAFAYIMIPKDTSMVVVNDVEYTWDELFENFQTTTFNAKDTSFEGILLSDIIYDTGLANPEGHQYIIASSDYQKTVNWTSMVNGFLVREGNGVVNDKITIFPGLPQQYWVYDVMTIEVI